MSKDTQVRLIVWPAVAMSLVGWALTLKAIWIAIMRLSGRLDAAGHMNEAMWLKMAFVVPYCAIAFYALVGVGLAGNFAADAIRREK
jgi:hypothetical protein